MVDLEFIDWLEEVIDSAREDKENLIEDIPEILEKFREMSSSDKSYVLLYLLGKVVRRD